MDYEQSEALKELQGFLEINRKPIQEEHKDSQALEADIQWDAARFWAKVIHAADVPRNYRTTAEFEAFTSAYETETGKDINIGQLFEEHWLRQVLGFVRVARTISSALDTFGKIRGFRQELQFLKDFQATKGSRERIRINMAELELAIVGHETAQATTLNREAVLFSLWATVKEDKVELTAIDIYFAPYLEHWDRFEFLYQWKKSLADEERGLPVSKELFQNILNSFAHFKDCPSLETLIEQKAIHEREETLYINFYGTEPAYWWALDSRIAGFFWEELINDDSIAFDEERVIIFLQKTMYWNHWPDHLSHVTSDAKKRFLDTSMQLLLGQTDLRGVAAEFHKLRLDSHDHRGVEVLYKEASNRYDDYLLDGSDLFELYQGLHQLEERAHITYLDNQSARSELTFLVRTIVRYDSEHAQPGNPSTNYFSRVLQLLREGIDKPFFLWKTTRFILSDRTEIIPHMLIQMDLCSVALVLVNELEFHSGEADIRTKAWMKSVHLLLKSLPEPDEDGKEVAVIIFNLFRELNADKYTIPYNRQNKQKERADREELSRREHDVLSILENAPLHKGHVKGTASPYLMPTLFKSLCDLFSNFKEKKLFNNGTIQFPMLQWDGMFWLIKMTTYWKYKDALKNQTITINNLAGQFLKQYLASLEVSEVRTYDHFEEIEKVTVPLWNEKIERLEHLEWIYPVYILNRQGKLEDFLSPRFKFDATSERYHKQNDFTADKVRTHIGVLLQVIRKLVVTNIPYGFKKESLVEVKQKIESRVISYIKTHVADKPEEGKVDLFSYSKEWRYQTTDQEALLPQLAQAINWFNDKQSVINAILDSGDLIKWLILLDYATAQGIKNTIIDRIAATDLTSFLRELRWVPEVQTILIKLANYSQLVDKFEEALQYWKETVVGIKDTRENKEQLYLSELLLAFFKKDEKRLDEVCAPNKSYGSVNEMDYRGQKEFYRSLLYIKTEPEKSYNLLNGLVYQYLSYPVIGMNRMVAKMNMAAATKNTDLYREAYEEWQTLQNEKYGRADLSFLEPDLSSNLMEILYHLDEFEKQNEIYAAMDLPSKMLPLALETRVRSLIKQKKTGDALALVETAKVYHQFADYTEIQFIDDLEIEIRGRDNVEELQFQYVRIFKNEPGRLVKILPPSFNGKTDLREYLVQEFVFAADKMLDKINAVDLIDDEDKYNDLIELVLDSRLNSLGWNAGGQSRGAYSGSEKDKREEKLLGRRDIPIFDSNKKALMVCEALIYRGASNTPSHLEKVFNYHHQRQAFIMMLYDNATIKKGFNGNWKQYTETIFPSAGYPAEMKIKEKIIEVSSDFGCEESAIKVGKSVHGENTIIYHIFINVNYKLEKAKATIPDK